MALSVLAGSHRLGNDVGNTAIRRAPRHPIPADKRKSERAGKRRDFNALDAGRGVFPPARRKGRPENYIQYREIKRKVLVAMTRFDGMVDAVILRCAEQPPQRPESESDVHMDKIGPCRRDHADNQDVAWRKI